MRTLAALAISALLGQSVAAAEPARMVADIVPGWYGSHPTRLADLSGKVLFTVYHDDFGHELWRSDGTARGTERVVAIDRAFGWGYAPWGGKLFFSQYDYQEFIDPNTLPKPWATDGTPAGTLRLADTPMFDFVPAKTGVLFRGEGSDGLWRSDGTLSGTGSLELDGDAWVLGTLGDQTLLWTTGPSGHALLRSDGSVEGTTRILHLPPGRGGPSNFVSTGSHAFFVVGDSLWRTDGTEGGTFAQPLPLPLSQLAPVGETLFLVLYDDAYRYSLWRTSENGQALVRLHGDVGFWENVPIVLAGAGSTLFFSAHDTAHGRELWRSDGTPEGTGLLRDIVPGPDGSSPGLFAAIDGVLVFVDRAGIPGQKLWRSDGTAEGTYRLNDLAPRPEGHTINAGSAQVDGVLLFAADDGIHGLELWRSDGTEEGTVLVQDIAAAAWSSNPSGFTVSGTRVFFSADDAPHGQELWAGWRGILTGRPERALIDLRLEVEALDLAAGGTARLLAKVDAAAAALERDDPAGAARMLRLFGRTLTSLRGGQIPVDAADALADLAGQTIDLLGGGAGARPSSRS